MNLEVLTLLAMSPPEAVASEAFELIYLAPGRLRTAVRSVVVLATNVLSMGDGPANPGGGRYDIIDRSSGEVLGSVAEWLGDDHLAPELHDDLEQLSAAAFREKWL